MTVFDINDNSIRQSLVHDRALGRVNATNRVAVLTAQLVATLLTGVLALMIGVRAAAFLAPIGGVVAALIVFWSPVRQLRVIDSGEQGLDERVGVEVE